MKKFNVLGCNDQFFKRFLNVLIFNASFGIGLLNNAVPGKFGINYYICTGEDPQKYDFLEPKVSKLHFVRSDQQSNPTKITSYMYKVEKSVLTTIFTLAKINLLYMKNAGTQWTMVSYLKK